MRSAAPTTEPAGPTDTGAEPADRAQRWAGRVVLGIAAVLLLSLVWRGATWDWLAIGDYGVMRLRSLDVGTSETPLVGVYSRFGWNHPGPMVFYAYAPLLRAFGGASHGMLVAAGLINAAAVAAAVWIARRADRVALPLVVLGLVAFVVGLGSVLLIDPWNPYVVVVPLFTTVVAAWRTLFGDRVAALVLVIAASWAIQTHVGTATVAGAVLAVGVVGLVVRALRGPERRHDAITLAVGAGVLLLCWLPPLIEQLTSSEGNVSLLSDYFLNNDEDVLGLGTGLRMVSHVLSRPFLPTTDYALSPDMEWSVPWGLVALIASGVLCWRRRWSSQGALVGLAGLTAAMSVLGASRVSGVPFPYLFRWVWVSGAVAWVAIAYVVVSELQRRWAWARWSGTVAYSLSALLLVGVIVSGPEMDRIYRWENAERAKEAVLDPAIDAMRGASGPILVTFSDGSEMGLTAELLVRAGDAGIDLRTTPDIGFTFGEGRVVEPGEEAGRLTFATGADVVALDADPEFRRVAEFDRLTPEERADLERLAAIDWASRPDGPADPGEDYLRLLRLQGFDEPVVVFLSTGP